MNRFAPRLVMTALLVAWCVPQAAAEEWRPWNLNSLVTASDAIVLAKKTGTRTVGAKGLTLTRYRLIKVYRGPLVEGERIDLRDWYPRKAFLGKTPEGGYGDKAISFLKRFDGRSDRPLRYLPKEERPRYSIVLSGLRLISRGRIYTFVEAPMHGAIAPAVLKRGVEFWPGEGDVTLAGFEEELRRSIKRVEVMRRVFKSEPSRKRTETLLALLGPYEAEAARRRKSKMHYRFAPDLFLQEMVHGLVKARDVEGPLEVFERWPWGALEAAARPETPARLRVAAIRTIDDLLYDDPPAVEALHEILYDSNEEVRRAARAQLGHLHRAFLRSRGLTKPREVEWLWKRIEPRITESADGKS